MISRVQGVQRAPDDMEGWRKRNGKLVFRYVVALGVMMVA
jgi:hypothetical protein